MPRYSARERVFINIPSNDRLRLYIAFFVTRDVAESENMPSHPVRVKREIEDIGLYLRVSRLSFDEVKLLDLRQDELKKEFADLIDAELEKRIPMMYFEEELSDEE